VIWVIKIYGYEIYGFSEEINKYFIFTKGCPKDLYTCKESRVVTTTAGDMAHVIKDSHIMTNHDIGVGARQWQINASDFLNAASKRTIRKTRFCLQVYGSLIFVSWRYVLIHALYLISNGCGHS
jgi:hypothetical protein